jgi:hypothetical protein
MSLPLYLVNHKAEMTVMRVQMFGWQGRNVAEDLCSFRTPFLQYIAFVKIKDGLSSGWLSRCYCLIHITILEHHMFSACDLAI